MATVNVNFRMDESLKRQYEAVLENLGMNATTGFNIFAKSVVRQGGIPFDLVDPFYSEANQAHLARVIKDYESGKAKLITKTMEELEAMEDE